MPKRVTPPSLIVVFGASGDLAKRKLIPSLYNLAQQGLLPEGTKILGYARTNYSDEEYRKVVAESIEEFAEPLQKLPGGGDAPSEDQAAQIHDDFVKSVYYLAGGYDDPDSFRRLRERVSQLEAERHTEPNRLFYIATPPEVFMPITSLLAGVGLAKPAEGAWTRLIIEKPFGHDLQSAKELNDHLLQCFAEDQIYRIDHYLGKETVQNILVFRFANGIFEPVWNRNYIDHVQITVGETLDIGDRGGYYEKAGALRDMVQNHMLQLVALTAMEPPVAFDAKSVRDQKVNLLRSIRPLDPDQVEKWVVRGQYGSGAINGKQVVPYLEAPGVAPDSLTETYVAWKIEIDNWRWNGVPFYMRTGKTLAAKVSEINIVFRKPPLMLFEEMNEGMNVPHNVLTIRIQPDETISLSFDAKRPGPQVELERVRMNFSYSQSFGVQTAEAYERLLLDALLGDGTLFIRRDETEVAWDRVTRILDGWAALAESAKKKGVLLRLPQYEAGSWGPPAAEEMMRRDGRYWRNG